VLQRSSRSNIDGSCCDEQAEEEKAQPRHPERNESISPATRLALEASVLQLPNSRLQAPSRTTSDAAKSGSGTEVSEL
jgi:hypothetical protein